MIELFSEKTPQETLAELRSQGVTPLNFKRELKSLKRQLMLKPVERIRTISLHHVVSNVGTHYEAIDFLVLDRFKRDGDIYLAGQQYCVNVSRLIREIQLAMTLWRRI